MANKTRAPRHRLRARRAAAKPPVDHAARFEAALRLTEIEDFVRGPEQCSLCGSMTPNRAMRIAEYPDGHVRLVPLYLCPACRDDDGIARLDAILDSAT